MPESDWIIHCKMPNYRGINMSNGRHSIENMRYRRNKIWWTWRLGNAFYREVCTGEMEPI